MNLTLELNDITDNIKRFHLSTRKTMSTIFFLVS